ncbi:MAG: MFS transporter [Candidatus Helarchaeota archaeon]
MSKEAFELEAKEWTRYHTFLIIYTSIITFFGLFSIVYTSLINYNIGLSFGWDAARGEILFYFAIIGIGPLFAIFPRFLADRFGRKPMILVFSIISTSAVIGSNLSFDTSLFIILRIISGIFGINISTIIISEEVPARHRGKAIGSVTGIGMTASLLAAYLLTLSGPVDMWRYIYSIVAFIGLILVGLFWFKLKETRRFTNLTESERLSHSIFKPFQKKYRKILTLSSLTLFLTTWIYLTIKYYFRYFFENERASLASTLLSEEFLGYLLMPIFIGSIIGYYSAGYLSDKIGRKKTIYITVGIYFIGSIIFLNTWDISLIIISFFIINTSFAIFRLVAEILAVEFFQTDIRAAGSGWVFTFASIAGVVGNLIMFYLVDALGGWGNTFFAIGTSCLIALIVITSFLPETKHRIVEEIIFTEIENIEI